MSATALLLVFALASPPVEVEAERLEMSPDGWQADGIRLDVGGLSIVAPRATSAPSPTCPDGALSLVGPLRMARDGLSLTADRAGACPARETITMQGFVARGPRLRARADTARWSDGALRVDGASVSACGCDDPPWRVTAASATMTPGEGAWVHWPVLRAGGVPILAAPVAYVPLARRRTGVLLPTLGWDGDHGPWGRLPFFWALHDSADLTLSPGWRGDRGLTVDGRLRWAASAYHTGELEAWTTPGLGGDARDGVAVGRGAVPIGPLTLAVDGAWTSSREAWIAHAPGFPRRTRTHIDGAAGAAAVAGGLGIGLRADWSTRFEGALPGDMTGLERAGGSSPLAWIRASGGVGPAHLVLDAEALRAIGPGQFDRDVLGLMLTASSVHWLGPLRLRPVLIGRTRVHPAPDVEGGTADQMLAGLAGLEARVTLARRFGSARHVVAAIIDGRIVDARAVDDPLGLDDRVQPSRGAGVALDSRLEWPRWLAAATVRLDYEHLDPTRTAGPISLQARVEGPWAVFSADGAADFEGHHGVYLDARLGPVDGPQLTAGLLDFDADIALPWLRPTGLVLPTVGAATIAQSRTSILGARWPVGPLTLGWQGGIDIDDATLVGQVATADWRGRCACWSAGLWVGHEAGRPAPDVMLSLRLGR